MVVLYVLAIFVPDVFFNSDVCMRFTLFYPQFGARCCATVIHVAPVSVISDESAKKAKIVTESIIMLVLHYAAALAAQRGQVRRPALL